MPAPANISRRAAAARVRLLEVGVKAGWLSKENALRFLPRCTGFSINFTNFLQATGERFDWVNDDARITLGEVVLLDLRRLAGTYGPLTFAWNAREGTVPVGTPFKGETFDGWDNDYQHGAWRVTFTYDGGQKATASRGEQGSPVTTSNPDTSPPFDPERPEHFDYHWNGEINAPAPEPWPTMQKSIPPSLAPTQNPLTYSWRDSTWSFASLNPAPVCSL